MDTENSDPTRTEAKSTEVQIVKSDAETSISLSKTGTQGLAQSTNFSQAVKLIKKWLKKRKVGFNELRLVINRPYAVEEDIADAVSRAIKSVEFLDDKLKLWGSCNRKLKSLILIPNISVDMELMRMLHLSSEEIVKSYLSKHSLPAPRHSPYTVHYQDFDIDTGAELVEALKDLSLSEAREAVQLTDPRILYLIASTEIEHFISEDPEEGETLFTAFDCNDRVPPSLHFLYWLQQNVPLKYAELVFELKNQNWIELRLAFYEVLSRTEGKITGIRNDTIDNPDGEYLDNLLKKYEE